MEIKISEDKLGKIVDTIVNGIGIDKYDSFQSRSIGLRYVEFLTPETREYVISRYYPEINRVVVNDEKFYDLISNWVGSHKVYDLIKDELIKGIYKIYTKRFPSIRYPDNIRDTKFMSDEQFNKK